MKSVVRDFPILPVSKHISTHTEDKPFDCKICGRRFSQNSNLKTHMSTHTGDKPFHCEILGSKFSWNYSLKSHMSTHTGEKVSL